MQISEFLSLDLSTVAKAGLLANQRNGKKYLWK